MIGCPPWPPPHRPQCRLDRGNWRRGLGTRGKTATPTIPIVFTTGSDPVASGLVDSLARPGGNITGVSILNVHLIPKRIELISELVPEARIIAVLVNPNNAGTEPMTSLSPTRGVSRTLRTRFNNPKGSCSEPT
jgi:hypothetical protein